jgi:hypothetical protein
LKHWLIEGWWKVLIAFHAVRSTFRDFLDIEEYWTKARALFGRRRGDYSMGILDVIKDAEKAEQLKPQIEAFIVAAENLYAAIIALQKGASS